MISTVDELYKQFPSLRAAGGKDPVVKLIGDLMKNKRVETEDLFVIEGLWAYEKLLSSNVKIEAFLFCPEAIKTTSMMDMVRYFLYSSEKSYVISSALSNRLSGRDQGEGFFLLCSFQKQCLKDIELKENNLIVVLDGLEKPGNIGTIIRSVDAAGGDGLIICNSRVRKNNQKLIKSSMGSSFLLLVAESDITDTIAWLKANDFKIIVTDLGACKSYYDTNYKGRVAVVVGNEIRGISDAWQQQDCERVIIPMFGGADSLNVGVAATLVIYEASCRQRGIIGR